MAFDVLMDLEENAALPTFMRRHLDAVDTLETDTRCTCHHAINTLYNIFQESSIVPHSFEGINHKVSEKI